MHLSKVLFCGMAVLINQTFALLNDGLKHEPGRCVMYDHCGLMPGQNCVNNTRAIAPDTPDFHDMLMRKCPSIMATTRNPDQKVCCTHQQLDDMVEQMSRVWNLVGSCSACWKGFMEMWCGFLCSPDQSTFLSVLDKDETGVQRVAFHISPEWAESFYDSCKQVKFGPDNAFVMSLVGGGAKNYSEMLSFMGERRPGTGSPFDIDFSYERTIDRQSWTGVKRQCDSEDLSDRCSCIDCPGSCPVLDEMPPLNDGTWWNRLINCQTVTLGSEQPCLVLVVVMIYVVGLAAFIILGWSKWNQTRRALRISIQSGYEAVATDDETETTGTRSRSTTATFPSTNIPSSASRSYNLAGMQNVFFSSSPTRHIPFHAFLQRLFYRIGYFSARYVIWLLLFAFALTGIMLWASFSYIQIETNPIRLWVSPTSSAMQAKQFFDDNFGPFYRTEQLIFSTKTDDAIIGRDFVKSIFSLREAIEKLHVVFNNKSFGLQQLCFKPLGTACVVQSLTAYWSDNLSRFKRIAKTEESFLKAFDKCTHNPVECLPPFQQPLRPEFVLGGYDGTDYRHSKASMMTLVLENTQDEERLRIIDAWESQLRKLLSNASMLGLPDGVELTFMTENSIEKEINSESDADIMTITLSYLVMLLYSSLALGKYHTWRRFTIDSKFGLGIAGILLVLCSVVCSVGIYSLFGVKMTLIIAEVIPFLVLAVGVDNLFILVHAFDRVTMDQIFHMGMVNPPEERAGLALARMGPSILLSAMSQTLAFGLGALVSMPAVQSFALVAALAIWIDFLGQIFVFVGLLALDARRSESDRIDCMPCLRGPEDLSGKEYHEGLLQSLVRNYYAPFILHPVVKTIVLMGFSMLFLNGLFQLSSVEMGLDQRIALPRDSHMVKYFDDFESYFNVGPPVYFMVKNINLTNFEGQSITCARYSNCSTWSIANILEQERKRPNISYIAQPTASWMDDFMMWLNPSASSCCRLLNEPLIPGREEMCTPDEWDDECHTCLPADDPLKFNTSVAGFPKGKEFMKFLHMFLESAPNRDCPLGGKGSYSSAIVPDYSHVDIKASHFRTYHTVLKTQDDFIQAYKASLRISKEIMETHPGQVEVTPYSVFYVFFDQYLHLLDDAMFILTMAILSIFVCCVVLLGSLRNSLIVVLTVLMIIVSLVGNVMVSWGISFNAVSLVNIVICVGIAVEFCTHITRAFSVTSPNHQLFTSTVSSPSHPHEPAQGWGWIVGARERRVFIALVEVGSSIFSGITLTKFCGICILAFAQSKIFEVYYFRMYLGMVILGFLHGLVWLPVMLTWVGSEKVISGEPMDGIDVTLRPQHSQIAEIEDFYENDGIF